MFEEDWQALGIQPTADLTAIKRAYAKRLKLTRPDDDAQAYQALREAYERTQQWAHWQRWRAEQEAASAGNAAEAAAPSALPEPTPVLQVVEPPVEAPATSPVAPAASPEQLVDEAAALWRAQGGAALVAHWPRLRQQLDELPLAQLPEASARLADWVLQHHSLPDDVVNALQSYFGWLDDFRAGRVIGHVRVQALREYLAERDPRPISDPDILAHSEPVRRVHRLWTEGRGALALWIAVLMGPALAALVDDLGGRRLRALGLDIPAQQALQQRLLRARLIRGGLVPLVLGAYVQWRLGHPGATSAAVMSWLLMAVLGSGALAWLGLSMHSAFGLRTRNSALARQMQRWHEMPQRPWVGLGGLLLAVAAALWANSSVTPEIPLLPWLPWLALLVLGAVSAWPRNVRHGFLAIGGTIIATTVFFRWWASSFEGWPAVVWVTLAVAWALFGCLLYERSLFGASGGSGRFMYPLGPSWLVAPLLNSLAACDRWGHQLALTPVGLCLALLFVNAVGPSGMDLLVWWIFLVLGLGMLQAWAFGQAAKLGR